jgi:hypothetical protein
MLTAHAAGRHHAGQGGAVDRGAAVRQHEP